MNEIVYQVKSYSEYYNHLFPGDRGNPHEFDHGIFETASTAIDFIEKNLDKEILRVLENGDWAWIDARPAEPIEIGDPVDKEEFFAKGVLIYYRNSADTDRTSYYIVTRIVKESA